MHEIYQTKAVPGKTIKTWQMDANGLRSIVGCWPFLSLTTYHS